MTDPRQMEMMHRYLDDELAANERAAFERELDSDPGLADKLAQLELLAEATSTLKILPAPVFDPSSSPAPWFRLPPRAASFAAGMAAAAACVLLGFGIASFTGTAPVPDIRPASLRLVYFAPEASSVSVIGDFNKWSGEIPLTEKGRSGYWQVELSVDPGEYHYTLILNGNEQVTDPTADYVVDDDFGSKNSVVKVGI